MTKLSCYLLFASISLCVLGCGEQKKYDATEVYDDSTACVVEEVAEAPSDSLAEDISAADEAIEAAANEEYEMYDLGLYEEEDENDVDDSDYEEDPSESAASVASNVCTTCNGTRTCPYCNGLGTQPSGLFCDPCAGKGTCPTCSYGLSHADILRSMGVDVENMSDNGGGGGNAGTVVCGRCNGTGRYYWSGTPRYSGSGTDYTSCLNCGMHYEIHSSHSCQCRACGGTGRR